jgi:hypothetical protein
MKPFVRYVDLAATPEVGKSACLYVREHPLLGTGWITTSAVVRVLTMPTPTLPTIETCNTIYYEPTAERYVEKKSVRATRV